MGATFIFKSFEKSSSSLSIMYTLVPGMQKSMFSAIRRSFSSTKKDLEIVKENVEKAAAFNANPVSLTSSSVPQPIFKDRLALIYSPTRNVMQSGRAQTKFWQIKFNSNVPRWENPLMGWTSSRDPIQGIQLKFKHKNEAIEYAKEQGWAYEVKDAQQPVEIKPKNYAENFKYSPGKLKIIKTK